MRARQVSLIGLRLLPSLHTHTYIHTHALTHSVITCASLSNTHTHTLTHSHTHTHTHTRPYTECNYMHKHVTLANIHTHSHNLMHTPTHTCAHTSSMQLLRSMLPGHVIKRLKAGQTYIAEHHEQVREDSTVALSATPQPDSSKPFDSPGYLGLARTERMWSMCNANFLAWQICRCTSLNLSPGQP